MANIEKSIDVDVPVRTAYEIRLSLVGSEMCIRDSVHAVLECESGHRPVSYTHLTLPTIYSV